MPKLSIVNRWSGKVIIEGKYDDLKSLLKANHGADLCGANLRGANLRGADLYGANLRGADLYGAIIKEGITLKRNPLTVGPVGSRSDTLFMFSTNEDGTYYKTGCFLGSEAEFIAELNRKDKESLAYRQYSAIIGLADITFDKADE